MIFRRNSVLFLIVSILLMLSAQASGALAAQAASCRGAAAPAATPNDLRGIITRVTINPTIGNGMVSSVTPNLFGLGLERWITALEQEGVNNAELYLQPDINLPRSASIPPDVWAKFKADAFAPAASQRAASPVVDQVTSMMMGKNGARNITAQQQTELFIAFLKNLQALKDSGRICGSVHFMLVERRWFRNVNANAPAGAARKIAADEGTYARTVANLVNQAKAAGLDQWLSGVLLTEHTNTDPSQIQALALGVAAAINNQTGGWLKSRMFIVSGGGFGNQFNGFNAPQCLVGSAAGAFDPGATCRTGQPMNFFRAMSGQVGSFAFAVKLFSWKTAPTRLQFCASVGCNPEKMSAADVHRLLADPQIGLGLSDLIAYINANAAAYPRLANVVFIGNGSDNLHGVLRCSPDGRLGDSYKLQEARALSDLFQKGAAGGGGWNGKLFMDGFSDPARMPVHDQVGIDDGTSLLFVNNTAQDGQAQSIARNPFSIRLWKSWPAAPGADACH